MSERYGQDVDLGVLWNLGNPSMQVRGNKGKKQARGIGAGTCICWWRLLGTSGKHVRETCEKQAHALVGVFSCGRLLLWESRFDCEELHLRKTLSPRPLAP